VGVSAGGAQDATAFRRNVEEGYVPQPSDLSYEGLYHDYYFDTAAEEPCETRFCPSYSRAVTRDPISNETERFLAVGLNSGISQAEFQRERLDLVVVLDVSGSMESRFNQYYYDENGDRREVGDNQRKMAAASDAVVSLTERLGEGDRFGLVTYEDDASTVQELRAVGETDVGALRDRIQSIRAGGGTNLDAGMRAASEMVQRSADPGAENRSTRVVYVTDAQPNQGELRSDVLGERLRDQAENGVYSTFVGVGVDFNSRLTEELATTRGANYYAIDSPAQFEKRMDEGFAYMVTPLAHDLSLSVETDGYEVEEAYGTPGGNTEELISVASLFPSRRDGNRTEGSVMLLELDRVGDVAEPEVTLTASYEDPAGETHRSTRTITMADRSAPFFESSGVRKAVALTEYANLVRNWAAHERALAADEEAVVPGEGVEHHELGRWEQTSRDLTVSPPYDDRIDRFTEYFREHREALGADRMAQDLAILEQLAARGDKGPDENVTTSP